MIVATVVADLHRWLSWIVVVANALAGVWALAAHRVARLHRPALWWFTGFAQATLFVQAGLGSWLIAREDLEAPEYHALYGFAALAAVGILYSYRAQMRGRELLLYGGGGLFLMGMVIRAMVV